MKGKIFLDVSKNQKRSNGYPVKLSLINGAKNRIQGSFKLYYEKEEWDFEKKLPKSDISGKRFILRKRAELQLLMLKFYEDSSIDINKIKEEVLGLRAKTPKSDCFYEFAGLLINELKTEKDSKGFNKLGNAKVYKNAIEQLKKYMPKLTFYMIDYRMLIGFIRLHKSLGNKNSTIHNYLRTYRSIYNEAVRREIIQDKKPFKDVFKMVTVRKNRTLKKHISKEDIAKLENARNLPIGRQFAVDMWLLQFYFGGQDFKDIYYLENKQINKNRVVFLRGKLDEVGFEFDLLIPDKARVIIEKYNSKNQFVFPGRKDFTGYQNILRRVQKNLILVQKELNIEVLPQGGNLGTKVSRHTFATLGRYLFIDPDLLRALMGHERNEVDTIYKDVYPREVRDSAQLKIINL